MVKCAKNAFMKYLSRTFSLIHCLKYASDVCYTLLHLEYISRKFGHRFNKNKSRTEKGTLNWFEYMAVAVIVKMRFKFKTQLG